MHGEASADLWVNALCSSMLPYAVPCKGCTEPTKTLLPYAPSIRTQIWPRAAAFLEIGAETFVTIHSLRSPGKASCTRRAVQSSAEQCGAECSSGCAHAKLLVTATFFPAACDGRSGEPLARSCALFRPVSRCPKNSPGGSPLGGLASVHFRDTNSVAWIRSPMARCKRCTPNPAH